MLRIDFLVTLVDIMQNIGVKDNRFCYRYVVVFQYGSAVLFNIADHEAEYYLDIIRKHASGWLPEMRKDGMPSLPTAKLCSVYCFLVASIFVFLDNICMYRKQYSCLLLYSMMLFVNCDRTQRESLDA